MSGKWMILGLLLVVVAGSEAQKMTPRGIQDTLNEPKDTLLKEDPFEQQYQKNILKSRINGIYIPKDLYDSFEQLKRLMDQPTLLQFQTLPEERAGRKLYLVMWLVENWHFREGSRLSHLIRQLGITYPEHMAHFIVITFHRHLNKKDLGIKERVEFYKEKEKEAFEKTKKNQKKEVIHEEKRKRKQ